MEKGEPTETSKSNSGPFITHDLCMAYRQALEQRFRTTDEKIRGLRNQIIGAITLSTTIIGLVMYVLSLKP